MNNNIIVIKGSDFSQVKVSQIDLGTVAIRVVSDPTAAGTISGEGYYNVGDEVLLVAVANFGYSFVRWSDGVTTSSRTITVGVESETYTAEFEVNSSAFVNSFTWGSGGISTWGKGSGNTAGTTMCTINYAIYCDTDCTFVIKPNSGYEITAYYKTNTMYNYNVSHDAQHPHLIYVSGIVEQQVTVPAGNYVQLQIRNPNITPHDLTDGPIVIGVDGSYTMVAIPRAPI